MEATSPETDRSIPAIPVSRGIGIGHIVFLTSPDDAVYRRTIPLDAIDPELARLRTAIAETRQQLVRSDDTREAELLGVQDLILSDPDFIAEIEDQISRELVNAEWAVRTVADSYQGRQALVRSREFSEKALDIDDAARRVLHTLIRSSAEQGNVFDAVVVARELRPSAMIELGRMRPAAIITERAGWTSHASILAREYELPMVSGVNASQGALHEHDLVIVDAVHGRVIVDPDFATIQDFREKSLERGMRPVERGVEAGTVTSLDDVRISIHANVDKIEAYRNAQRAGAVGVGLYRSESLLQSDGTLPSEDEQARAYRQIAEAVDDGMVNIRTFDIGIEYFKRGRSHERNPSLGLRAIRLGLRREKDLRMQLRAILRAATEEDVGLILPMVSGVEEVLSVRSILDEEMEDLSSAGTPFGRPRLGAMIELPSAVLTADDIAAETDFLCLGTNDLVQYLLAVDRDNDAISNLYKTLHPAVLKAIQSVVNAGRTAGKPVIGCGEMAGSPFYVPVLLGLGVTEISITVSSIRPVRQLISGIMVEECRSLVTQALQCKAADEIEMLLHGHYETYWEHLFQPGLLNTRHL